MRSKSSSGQLTMIIVLLLVLVVLLGSLVFLTFKGNKENRPVANSESISEEVPPLTDEEIDEILGNPDESSEAESLPEENTETPEEVPLEENKEEVSKPAPSKKPAQIVYPKKVFDKAGASYEAREIITNGYIANKNIAVRNRTFNENLYITADASDGEIVLQNVIVKGKLIINGAEKVTLHDVKVPEVIVETANRENELVVSGVSTIERLTLKASCTLDEENLAKGYEGVKNILISDNPSYVWLDADLYSSDVDTLYVDTLANVNVDRSSHVKRVIGASMLHLGGYGEVDELACYDDDITYETKPTVIKTNGRCDYPEYSDEKINLKTK